MCVAIVCFEDCGAINFGGNFIFLIKTFFYMEKRQDKNVNILITKRASKVIYKPMFSISKGPAVAKISSEHKVRL